MRGGGATYFKFALWNLTCFFDAILYLDGDAVRRAAECASREWTGGCAAAFTLSFFVFIGLLFIPGARAHAFHRRAK